MPTVPHLALPVYSAPGLEWAVETDAEEQEGRGKKGKTETQYTQYTHAHAQSTHSKLASLSVHSAANEMEEAAEERTRA
jgi:hypothetical protein